MKSPELDLKENAAIDDMQLDNVEDADQAPVVKLVNLIIVQAIRDKASDIHIEPQEKNLRIRTGSTASSTSRSPRRRRWRTSSRAASRSCRAWTSPRSGALRTASSS